MVVSTPHTVSTHLYTIYDKGTLDQPAKMVLRRWISQVEVEGGKFKNFRMIPKEIIHLGDTLEEMRSYLPADAELNLGRHDGEDPNIIESWTCGT